MKALILIFEICLTLSSTKSDKPHSLPLDGQPQSIDDMFKGCTKKMDEKVYSTYFPREMKERLFYEAWVAARSCAKKKYKIRLDMALSKDQVRALCVYTAEKPSIYGPFNTDVRTGAAKYTTSTFKYHALLYWITTAVQILNGNTHCVTTYRRTKVSFTGKVNQVVRFGSFTSTSKKADLFSFGTQTCFHIYTCLGAYLKEYSAFPQEKEVLVPPYETFIIYKITKGTYQKLSKCEKIFVLESRGWASELNCKAAGGKRRKGHHKK